MKITKSQLKRIIKEEYSRLINEYGSLHGAGAAEQSYSGMKGTARMPERKGHGWNEFIEYVRDGDYGSAGNLLQDLANDSGVSIDRETEDEFIMMAQDGDDSVSLNKEWGFLLRSLGG